jgi:hypothetical protein
MVGMLMSEDPSSLDARIEALRALEDRLRQHLPPPNETPAPARLGPLGTARFILTLFAIVGGCLLFQDAVAIFLRPDERVFVSQEGDEFHVWEDVYAYEAGTGKRWIEQPLGTTDLITTYHGARRRQALEAAVGHVLLLVLSVVALRNLRQQSEDSGA